MGHGFYSWKCMRINALGIYLWFVMCLKWFNVLVGGKEGEVIFSLTV